MKEDKIIKKLFLQLSKHKGINTQSITKNFTDDLAYINKDNIKDLIQLTDKDFNINNTTIVVSTDSFVEGYHLIKNNNYSHYANKLFYRNLSDILCKNAKPLFYTLNIFLGSDTKIADIKQFTKALFQLNKKFNIFTIGGDTTINKSLQSQNITSNTNNDTYHTHQSMQNNTNQHSPFIASITIFGYANSTTIYSRLNNTNIKDINHKNIEIYICGQIGKSYLVYLEFLHTKQHKLSIMQKSYILTNTSVKMQDNVFSNFNVIASIDISDGLINDIYKLCGADDCVKYILNIKSIPFTKTAKKILDLCDENSIKILNKILNRKKTEHTFEKSYQKDFELYQYFSKKQLNKFEQKDYLNFIHNCISFGDDYNIAFLSQSSKTKNIKNISNIGYCYN